MQDQFQMLEKKWEKSAVNIRLIRAWTLSAASMALTIKQLFKNKQRETKKTVVNTYTFKPVCLHYEGRKVCFSSLFVLPNIIDYHWQKMRSHTLFIWSFRSVLTWKVLFFLPSFASDLRRSGSGGERLQDGGVSRWRWRRSCLLAMNYSSFTIAFLSHLQLTSVWVSPRGCCDWMCTQARWVRGARGWDPKIGSVCVCPRACVCVRSNLRASVCASKLVSYIPPSHLLLEPAPVKRHMSVCLSVYLSD